MFFILCNYILSFSKTKLGPTFLNTKMLFSTLTSSTDSLAYRPTENRYLGDKTHLSIVLFDDLEFVSTHLLG